MATTTKIARTKGTNLIMSAGYQFARAVLRP
jgi:hypothetical protein